MIERVKSLVRPTVTLLFVLGFVYMSLLEIEIPDTYTVMTGMILAFYFKSREDN